MQATSADVEYLLSVVKSYFPGADIDKSKIIASYAGIRPLVDDGSESEGKTSREHTIYSGDIKNITFVAGGKYTTYRKIAEEVVNHTLNNFSMEDQVRFGRSDTKRAINELSTVERNKVVSQNIENPLSKL